MKKLAWLQLGIVSISYFLALIFWDSAVAESVLLGGVSYFIPTILAIQALYFLKKLVYAIPMSLLIVEIHKILLVIVMMAAIFLWYPSINALAYVIGLILVTQVGLLMFIRNYFYE